MFNISLSPFFAELIGYEWNIDFNCYNYNWLHIRNGIGSSNHSLWINLEALFEIGWRHEKIGRN